MGFYEGPEKILAGTYYPDPAPVGLFDRALAGLGNRAIYLYLILSRFFLVYRSWRIDGENK